MIAPRRRPSSMAHGVDMGDLTVGTAGWVERTSGRLTTAKRTAFNLVAGLTPNQNAGP